MAEVLLSTGGRDPTPALLSLFDAARVEGGVEVRWRLESAPEMGVVDLERSDEGSEPWARVDVEPQLVDGIQVLLDLRAPPDHACWYRLRVHLESGETTFGPIQSTGRRATGFELSPIAPNPARGLSSVEFTTPIRAHVRLSVLDVQGRRADVLVDGDVAPGRHLVERTGLRSLSSLPPGLYFVRMDWPGGWTSRRFVVTR